MLKRDESLSSDLGEPSVDLLAVEVEERVDDEGSGLVEAREGRRKAKGCQLRVGISARASIESRPSP